jgi:hypothetical protein
MDAKLKRVQMKYGMEGYGLYWYCLELIAQTVDKNNLTFELEHDSELIADSTNLHYERVQEMMLDFVKWGLFEQTHTIITCLKMLTRTDEYTQKLIRSRELVGTTSRPSPDKVPPNRTEQKRTEEKRTDLKIKTKGRFAPPSLQDVKNYCQQRENQVNPQDFLDHYEANGWIRGKTKIKDWKACVRTWEKKSESGQSKTSSLGTSGVMSLGQQKNLTPRVGESMHDYASRVRMTRP